MLRQRETSNGKAVILPPGGPIASAGGGDDRGVVIRR